MHKRARDMQFHVQDIIDDHNHPTAHLLRTEMQRLEDDIQRKKSARSIEDRIKVIQEQIHRTQRANEGVFDPTSSTALHHRFEEWRRDIRKAPHY
jgi:hypothetical protein